MNSLLYGCEDYQEKPYILICDICEREIKPGEFYYRFRHDNYCHHCVEAAEDYYNPDFY